ncbi:MAG: pyridoxal phosphate-dependent aminotransferase [Clostridia bacterium]|nr:pyridoxal phosphate-dependent aminotransferase [Clostridia bacterium]
MISEKMWELGTKSSVIREIFEYGKKRKAEIGAENVFDFSLGNPSIPAPAKVKETYLKLISEADPIMLHGYTSAAGDLGVRSKIAEHISNKFGCVAVATDIYMTCGAAAALMVTLRAIVNAGDEVVVLAPFFPEYTVFIESAGAEQRIVKCREPDFQIDADVFEAAVNKNTKAVIINSPNNPTGAVLSEENIKKLSEILLEKQKEYVHEIYIIADEPYRELAYDVDVPYIPNYYDNTIVCYSYSKSLSLPGDRIGYVFVSSKVAESKNVFAAVCGAGRSLGYVCAPALAQLVIGECVDEVADISAYKENRDLLYNTLVSYGYEAVKPEGAFYLFVKSPCSNAAVFCEKAKEYEILFVPSDSFGYEGYVRISYCVSKKTIEKSLPAFKALMEEYIGA